jgi:hypothetical protein
VGAKALFFAIIAGSAVAAYLFLRAIAGAPAATCRRCRYHNHPRESRCLRCGELLR